MRRPASKAAMFRVGLVALIVILVACYFGFTKSNPFANPFEMSAAFRTANDLKTGSPVRIAGVTIGEVTEVDAKDGGAIVKMQLRDAGLPIHKDATLKIRPRIFLEGNWFVDLKPGSPGAGVVEEGHVIPVQQTAAPVQFGQLLEALQSDTRQDLQVVLDEYGRALVNGGARGFNRSIPYWKRAFRDSAIVNEAMLGTEPHDLSGYLRGSARFARGLDRDPEALKALVTNLAVTADAFASEDRNLTAAIRELPRTLGAGRTALGALNDAFPSARRFARAMTPAVRSSGPALDAQLPLIRELRGLVSRPELRGLVRELRPTVHNLAELNIEGVKLQKELRLLSSCTNNVMTPWRNSKVPDQYFPPSGPVFEEQVKWLPGIAAESRNFDANGQYVRSLANGAQYAYGTGDGRFFVTGAPLQGVNPPKKDTIPPLRGEVPCETQQTPDLRSNPQAPPEAIKVRMSGAGYEERSARSRERLLKWLKPQIEEMKLPWKLDPRPILREDIPRLTKAVVKP